MRRLVKRVDYCDLPLNFWDSIIFYDYYVSFSGLNEIEPHITMWTSDGTQYYINTNELRDRRFERVIPFFEPMADKEKITRGDFFYFNWELVADGWKYYYNYADHCFIPHSVYEEFSKSLEEYKGIDKRKVREEQESIEDMIVHLTMWRELLKQAYKKVLGITINEDASTYIRFDEKIHVYDELYVGKSLYIDQISKEDMVKLKNAAIWSINYTAGYEGLWNLINVGIYFENEEPFYLNYEFERQNLSNYIEEQEFMEKFMDIMECDFGSKKNGYCFNNAPKAFTVFQKSEMGKLFWIRDDLYQKNYHNVIEPFINYTGNLRFLSSPVCGCVENKEGYIDSTSS